MMDTDPIRKLFGQCRGDKADPELAAAENSLAALEAENVAMHDALRSTITYLRMYCPTAKLQWELCEDALFPRVDAHGNLTAPNGTISGWTISGDTPPTGKVPRVVDSEEARR